MHGVAADQYVGGSNKHPSQGQKLVEHARTTKKCQLMERVSNNARVTGDKPHIFERQRMSKMILKLAPFPHTITILGRALSLDKFNVHQLLYTRILSGTGARTHGASTTSS
ncbi:hypothetical protein TNCV_1289591 [Trichonephila clavipes]|nr:hypothetical protein TNCV_1289591 [Trichonephila clavipes]